MTQVSQSTKDAYKLHLIMLLKLSWPNFLTSLIQLGLPVTSTIAVGHIIGETGEEDSKLIGAAALGNMFANASGFAIGSGLAMALDTLCSQAFGAKKFKLVGLHCQRAMVILTLACIPIAFIWYNAWVILQYIGQDPAIAILSQFWIHRLLPALWPRIMYETYRRYLLSQRVMWPLTVSVAITVPVHVLMTYTLVFSLGWGFAGAAWAMSFSYWFLFLTVLAVSNLRLFVLRRKERRERGEREGGNRYAKGFMIDESKSEKENEDEGEREKRESGSSLLSASLGSSVGLMENEEREEEEVREERERNGDPLHTWPAWSKDVFRGWVSFFKLGIATALSLFIEWGSFEVNAAIAAYLGDVPLAAHAIMCNSVSVWYAFPLGVATATTALVGNMLGAGEPDRAKIAARIGMVIALIYGIFNGAFGLLYRDFLGLVFTSDAAVVKAISNVMFVMWLYGLVDAMKAVGTAILRGSGRPKLTVYGNILSCIFIGYPVALAMVFKGGFGLGGIWFGMSTAWMCAATIFTIIISKTNWQLEVLNAAKRNSEAEKSTEKGKERMKEGLLMSVVVKDEEKRGEEEGEEDENEESDDNNNGKKNGYNAVSVNG